MNENKSINSLKKQLVAAVAMVCVAAVALGSSTYAWFAANNKVQATGMTVQAQSVGGIVISNESQADWKTSASASHQDKTQLIPTSTADTKNWYHNVSDDAGSAKAGQAASTYTKLNLTTDNNGVGKDNANKQYYLLNKFYIKSSAEKVDNGKIYIQKVTVSSGVAASAKLDASLRVAIVMENKTYIYAPVDGATLGYKVGGAADETTAKPALGVVNTETVTGIPANTTDNPLEAAVYIYFEGEDGECKSENITSTLDSLQLTVDFGTEEAQTT